MMDGQQGESALYNFLHISKAGQKEDQNKCTKHIPYTLMVLSALIFVLCYHIVIIQSVASEIVSAGCGDKQVETDQPTLTTYWGKNSLLRMADPKGCHFLLKVIHQSNLRQDRRTESCNGFVW